MKESREPVIDSPAVISSAAPPSSDRDNGRRRPDGLAGGLLRTIRPHQWAKNILLLLPLALAHEVGFADPLRRAKLVAGLWAFVSFSFCASAAYVLNDLHDLQADRRHPTKRNRPFASGRVPVGYGAPLLGGLIAASAAIAIPELPSRFVALLSLYFILTLSYSFYFKRKLLLDVVLLAGLYTLRIIAGAVAVNVPLTPWMLAFSMFFFLSLAFAKRYTEVMGIEAAHKIQTEGRGYRVEDLSILPVAGLASGYLSVLVFALYINDVMHGGGTLIGGISGAVAPPRVVYPRPYMLWLICPVLLYWVTRLWFIARRGALHDDPVVFAMEDRVSWMAGVLAVLLVVLASLPQSVTWLP